MNRSAPNNYPLTLIFLMLCAAAALIPLFSHKPNPTPSPMSSPQWPSEIEGRPLTPIPLSAQATRFASAFPGQIRAYTDGQRDYVLRWVTSPTRLLHSSADCLRGSGFSITAQPVWKDASGAQWGCFIAQNSSRRLLIRERISQTSGEGWTDVSAWYWHALLSHSKPPWLAITIIEPE